MERPSFSRRTAFIRFTSFFIKVNSSSTSVMRLRNRSSVVVSRSSLAEACLHQFQTLIHRGGECNVLGSEPLLNPLILRLKTFLHGLEDDRSLIGQKLTESLFADE